MLQEVESLTPEWSEEEEGEGEEEEIPAPQVRKGKGRATASASKVPRVKTSNSLTRPSQGPMFEESSMTEEDLT